MPESKQFNLIFIGLGVGLALLYMAKQAANATVKKMDEWAKDSTQGLGEAFSELSARLNGWEPVELTPLQIKDAYLKDDFTLTNDARKVLWSIDQYRPVMIELFGNEFLPMKAKYRALINVPITKDQL